MSSSKQSDANPFGVRPFDIELLKTQQARLRHYGRLHWAHWLILCLSLIITIFAWKTSQSALDKQDHIRFDREAERVMNLMRERIRHYEDALLSGVAAMQSHDGEMTRAQWRRYSQFLRLNQRYPGISGIGVIHYVDTANIPDFLDEVRQDAPNFNIHPYHLYDISLPITYIEPEASNAAAVGLDVAFEKNRRTAALNSRLSGTTQISGPIVLVQDEAKTPGFLFYAPYYDRDNLTAEGWDSKRREANFSGMIYAPLVVRDLVKGVLSEENRHVSLTIHDEKTVLYEETNPDEHDIPRHSLQEDVEMHGRIWTFSVASTPSFTEASSFDQPTVVLLSGLGLDAMLFVLFGMMSRSNRQVLLLAEDMTDNLSRQAIQLSENNRDLESFAHIVSHDLKTPIRNIYSLTEILEDDLSEYMASNDAHAEIQGRLDGLRDQATKSQSLISGILEYSIQNATDLPTTIVDTEALVIGIGEQLSLADGQLRMIGEFPVLKTNRTRLEQALTNLVDNAIKYNPDKDNATVKVAVEYRDDTCYFAVTDNGPGIEKRFHERIFLPFTTLNAESDVHSSGIGLSIVKRSVERQGGSVTVESRDGEGTTFRFSWPDANAVTLQAAG